MNKAIGVNVNSLTQLVAVQKYCYIVYSVKVLDCIICLTIFNKYSQKEMRNSSLKKTEIKDKKNYQLDILEKMVLIK